MKPIEKPEALEKREARPSRQGEWSLAEIEKAAQYMAKSGLFGVKDPVQAVALMLLAQAEGTHPARAVQEYHIIGGRPASRRSWRRPASPWRPFPPWRRGIWRPSRTSPRAFTRR